MYWLFLSASLVKFNFSPIFEPYLNVPLVIILGATEVKEIETFYGIPFFPTFCMKLPFEWLLSDNEIDNYEIAREKMTTEIIFFMKQYKMNLNEIFFSLLF